MKTIAKIRNAYDSKFGVPRQSGLVDEVVSQVVFEPGYRSPDAVRGMDEFTHIWLIWGFDGTERENDHLTVRPPILGGNTRMGVFATRSPFRPNPIGLSCVRLLEIRNTEEGPVLFVAGADMVNGTAVYDIKPYLPYADCHPDAAGGFTDRTEKRTVEVRYSQGLAEELSEEERKALTAVLGQDPRPAYQDDPDRIYRFEFGGRNIAFSVEDGILTVLGADRK